MLKPVDALLKPVMDKLSKTDAPKRKGAVLGMLGVSIFAVFGISIMLVNTSDINFLPETGTIEAPIMVGNPGDTDDGSGCDYGSALSGEECTLREAINLANENANDTITIRFADGITKIDLLSTLPEITRAGETNIIGRDNPEELVIYMNRTN